MTRELLKQALDALEQQECFVDGYYMPIPTVTETMKAIREHLAQPEWSEPTGKVLTLADSLADLAGTERPGTQPRAAAIGKILSESEMGISYDRRMGNVIWWNKPPGPALLYTHPAVPVPDEQGCLACVMCGAPAAPVPAAPVPAVPPGRKLVPLEPTPEMQMAALDMSRARIIDMRPLPMARELWASAEVYRAMIAAAPPPVALTPLTEEWIAQFCMDVSLGYSQTEALVRHVEQAHGIALGAKE